MRQHVVGDDQIGGSGRSARSRRASSRPKKVVERAHPGLDRRRGRRLGRIDAEHRDAARDEVLQHVAVVARDLDHERAGAEPQPLDQLEGMRARVGEQRARDRGEVRVVAAEQDLGRDRLG